MRVLFLASNPQSTERLALDKEARAIRVKARLAEFGRVVDMQTRLAVQADDLQQDFLDIRPHVVHFSGHADTDGIVLHAAGDGSRRVSATALAGLFRVLQGEIRLVVLNACSSEEQARAIVDVIDTVIGMTAEVDDEAARYFSAGLYRGLASDVSVAQAFDMGKVEMGLMGHEDSQHLPKLLTRPGVDAAEVFPLRQSQPSMEILPSESTEAPSLNAEFRIRLDLDERKTTVWIRDEPLGEATWQPQSLQRAMSRFSESRGRLVRGTGKEAGLLRQAGESLFEGLLPGDFGKSFDQALGNHLKARGAVASLVVEVATPQAAALPVETLISPTQGVLGSHQRMRLFRRVLADEVPASPEQLPAPPLRVLFVVSSPDSSSRKGNLLDFELEEWVMLRALQPLIAKGHAILETLEEGSLDAVEEALKSETFHVLHYTGHGSPGHLHMEGRDGEEAPVSQEELAELLMRFPSLRLVVLSGCSTANPTQRIEKPSSDSPETNSEESEAESGPEVLQGLALGLSELGIPFVIGMQESVPDAAATLWAEAFYRHLARHDADVPAAFQASRHLLKQLEQEQPPEQGNWGQWPLPVLYQRGTQTELFDTSATPDRSRAPLAEASTLYEGIARLGAGRFIGRRALRRRLSRRLREPAVGALLLYGLGGIGKSALATQLAETARRRSGAMVLALRAPLEVDGIIKKIRQLLRELMVIPDLPEAFVALVRNLDRNLGEGTGREPAEQMELVISQLATRLPLLLFLDNFEDELDWVDDHWQVKNTELARVLTLWAQQPGPSKLLITSRYPFQLDGLSPSRFEAQMVGPLDEGEARKLMLRFPALRALSWQELGSIHERLGGHPRSIEYLAAKLEHGDATWGQFGAELDRSLLERQLDPEQLHWGDDGEVLQETATHAVGDILLDSLLQELDDDAEDLLRRTAVYRQPVAADALSWLRGGRDVSREVDLLIQLSFLYCENSSNGSRYLVHRVTAESLLDGAPDALRVAAHQAAAEYFEHSGQKAGLQSYLEARWHWLQCGEVERASAIALAAQSVLQRWGYWTHAEQLNAETWTLEGISQTTKASAAHNLGICHHLRGAYDDALKWYKKSLSIEEELGNKAGMANSYHQIGMISELRGDYDDALEWYKKAVKIFEELDDRAGMANSYGQLGNSSNRRGDYDDALICYKKSLAIFEELGDEVGMANSYHHFGMVSELRGDYADALKWYKKSLAILEELGNQVGMAASYHQLGMVSELRGGYADALEWYKKSLSIEEELGNKAGMAASYHQLGMISELRGDYDDALEWYKKSLSISEELGNKADMAASYHQLGMVSQERGAYDDALNWYKKSLAIKEELGDKAGIATSLSQIGILLTKLDQVAEAVPLTLQSLMIRMEIQVPIGINTRQLHHQEALLGAESFRSILVDQLGEETATALIEQLQAAKEPQADPDATTP